MLLRFLDTRPGRESECLRCLQGIATRMIQQERLDAVQICRYADGSGRIVWIEDRRTASRSGRVLDAEVAETCADTLVHGPVSQPFELVDGFYHYPLPRCYVWTLEVSPATGQEEGTLTDFLDRARTPSAEPSVAGMSVYRALGTPRLQIFVALSEDVVPSDGSFLSPGLAAAGTWRRLLVVWTMGRVLRDPERREHAAPALYPRPTFWARTMPVLAVCTDGGGFMTMFEPPRATPGGKGLQKGLQKIIYVITCGMCGQSWQRPAAHDGQAVGCIFCGSQGHVRLGVAPPDGGVRGEGRIEAWLHTAGAEEH
jgi:hypothetical protein